MAFGWHGLAASDSRHGVSVESSALLLGTAGDD